MRPPLPWRSTEPGGRSGQFLAIHSVNLHAELIEDARRDDVRHEFGCHEPPDAPRRERRQRKRHVEMLLAGGLVLEQLDRRDALQQRVVEDRGHEIVDDGIREGVEMEFRAVDGGADSFRHGRAEPVELGIQLRIALHGRAEFGLPHGELRQLVTHRFKLIENFLALLLDEADRFCHSAVVR